jgi:6-phosphogluconolactonase
MSTWPYELVVAADRAELSRLAAERFVAAAEAAVAAQEMFTVALSGGSTPRDLYRLLAGEPWRSRVDWSRTHVFWGDERCVPPDHPDSNYCLACELLLEPVGVPAANVHRMRAESAEREAAAASYAEEIMRIVPSDADGLPRFDLMLQGLGSDGHTASLLPGDPLVHESSKLVAVTNRDREGTLRFTVTAPVLQHAASLLFLVAGQDKAEVLREVLQGELRVDRYPAQVVREAQGEVVWLVDRAAAAELTDQGRR